MPEIDSLTLIVKGDPLTAIDGWVGLVIEHAQDALLPVDADRQVSMSQLLGSFDDAKRRAWELTQKLLANEQPVSGVLQLRVSEEIIIRELESIFVALHLDRWLTEHKVRQCRFRAASPLIGRLRDIQQLTVSSYQVIGPAQAQAGRFNRVAGLVGLEGIRGMRQAAVLAARHFYPCGSRYFSALRHGKRSRQRGGWWFYSTAYTFTNIGLAYEPFLPEPLRFLCEDAGTGGRPLNERGRDFDHLYAYARFGDMPRQGPLSAVQRGYKALLRSVALSGEEEVARDVLLSSNIFQQWLSSILPLTWFHSRIFDRWINEMAPEAILVGNAAYEGVLLQLASAAGVPTILLQHGILGDYYQLMNHCATTLLVRGSFWHEFVSPQSRKHTRVLNIPYTHTTQPPSGKRNQILFLTSVDSALAYSHASDVREIVATLMKVAHDEAATLVVRVHPLESVGYYKQIVSEIRDSLHLDVLVKFSEGSGLEELLQNTSVAVTYNSTVFLDCLRLAIPIVSFGWHQFSYRELIDRYGIFHFARDLRDLGRKVTMAVHGELASNSSALQLFLAPTTPDELSHVFKELVRGDKGRVLHGSCSRPGSDPNTPK